MMATCSALIFFHLTVFCTIQVCPETIVGVIGGSIVIPCSSEEHQPSIQDITVRWRQNSLNVYDIIKGTGSVEGQDPAFKNRVESFPKEYLNGNFSLKLNSIRNTDKGEYTCFIIEESKIRNVHLDIEKKPVRDSFSQGTKPQPEMTVIIISILCIGFIFSLANFATENSMQLHVPVPSPNKRRRGWRRMPIH